MNEEQEQIAEDVLRQYIEKHAKLREVRSQYSDDADLFEALFGRKPHGILKVWEGPITLYIQCHDPEDYTFISSQEYLSGRPTSKEDKKISQMSSGVNVNATLIPGLEGAITVENAHGISRRDFRQLIKDPKKYHDEWLEDQKRSTYFHEEQHAIKRLFSVGRRWLTACSKRKNEVN